VSLYRRVSVKMWGDAKFRALSKPAPNAQTLWIYLLTGEHTIIIPGVVRAGEAALAEALGWSLRAFRKAFAEIHAQGMARRDWSARLAFLPNALKHNPPQSPKVVVAWCKAFEELPDCELKIEIGLSIKAYLKDKPEAFQIAFAVALPEGIPNTGSETERSETEVRPAHQVRSTKPDFEDWFEEQFKPAYPLIRRIQQKAAIAELRRIKPSPEDRAVIMARLEAWKKSDDWTKGAGKYVPGMGKFFVDGWFEREPQAVSRNGKGPAAMPPTADEYYGGANERR
jgi:hypothetical protein